MPCMELKTGTREWIKTCTECKYIYTVTANLWVEAETAFSKFFPPHTGTLDSLQPHCRTCQNNRHYRRIANGKQRHDLLIEQDGKCAICNKEISFECHGTEQAAVVDHNHKTGVIRGILCHGCNAGLGFFEKRGIDWLANILDYVKKHT